MYQEQERALRLGKKSLASTLAPSKPCCRSSSSQERRYLSFCLATRIMLASILILMSLLMSKISIKTLHVSVTRSHPCVWPPEANKLSVTPAKRRWILPPRGPKVFRQMSVKVRGNPTTIQKMATGPKAPSMNRYWWSSSYWRPKWRTGREVKASWLSSRKNSSRLSGPRTMSTSRLWWIDSLQSNKTEELR